MIRRARLAACVAALAALAGGTNDSFRLEDDGSVAVFSEPVG